VFRVLSLSKFRSWLTDSFSSNKAASSLQRPHSPHRNIAPQRALKGDKNQKEGKPQEKRRRDSRAINAIWETHTEKHRTQTGLFSLETLLIKSVYHFLLPEL